MFELYICLLCIYHLSRRGMEDNEGDVISRVHERQDEVDVRLSGDRRQSASYGNPAGSAKRPGDQPAESPEQVQHGRHRQACEK